MENNHIVQQETQPSISHDDISKEIDALSESNPEITGMDLLLQEIEEIDCLVAPILQRVGLACLGGSSDTGKSSILRQLAIEIVTGKKDFLGFNLNPIHHSVIYVSTEDLQRETAFLLKKQATGYGPELLKGLRFVFETEDLYNELDKRLTAAPADAIIMDCLADAYGGDLKDTQKIRIFLHKYQQLAQKHMCLILFLHHTSKRTEDLIPSKNNLLSGQGLEAKMRIVIELRIDHIIPMLRHFCIVKGNYLPARYKRDSFVLKFDEATFSFNNTGDRTPFELLAKQENKDDSQEKFEIAFELLKDGKSYSEIAKEMGYSAKSSVAKIFKKAKERGWTKGEEISEVNDAEIAFPVSSSLEKRNGKR